MPGLSRSVQTAFTIADFGFPYLPGALRVLIITAQLVIGFTIQAEGERERESHA